MRIAVCLCVALGLLLLLPGFMISPIDVITGRQISVAERRNSEGHQFRVTQCWEGGDFYTTRFEHTEPDGSIFSVVIDPDANKWWSCEMVADEEARETRVLRKGRTIVSYDWEPEEAAILMGANKVSRYKRDFDKRRPTTPE